MLLILSINTVLLPVAVSFFRELINPGWLSFTCFSDMLFIIDIVLNFWTGVITDENIVILDLRMIRRIYVKRWLLFDILSVFPFDYMAIIIIEANSLSAAYLQATTALRLLRLLKLLSLLRLFRVVKLMHYLAKWEEVSSLFPLPPSQSFVDVCYLDLEREQGVHQLLSAVEPRPIVTITKSLHYLFPVPFLWSRLHRSNFFSQKRLPIIEKNQFLSILLDVLCSCSMPNLRSRGSVTSFWECCSLLTGTAAFSSSSLSWRGFPLTPGSPSTTCR